MRGVPDERTAMQRSLFVDIDVRKPSATGGALLKWIGNKQRHADQIIANFPAKFGTYIEPFLGSGAILGALAPSRAWASDAFAPLMEIWTT